MSKLVNLVICGILISGAAAKHVFDLTDVDFDSTLADVDTALVMFYAPWCSHCATMKPQFDKASVILEANNPPVSLARVNCEGGSAQVCGRFSIAGYPTVKIFKNGLEVVDYSGPRTSKGIVKFMKTQVGPISKVSTIEKANALLKKDGVVVFGFGSEDDDLMETLWTVAENFRKFTTTKTVAFAQTSEPAVMEQLGHTEGVVMYRPGYMKSPMEHASILYQGEHTDDTHLEEWVNKNYHGVCGLRTKENLKDFSLPLVVAYFPINYAMDAKGTNYWRNRVLKVAKSHQGWNYAMSHRPDFQEELVEVGIEAGKGNTPVVVATNQKGEKFKMEGDFSVGSFDSFLSAMRDGEVRPYHKSGPIPETQGKVKEVVADNFQELVTNNNNDVLINFYAPWRKLTNKLVYELGEQFQGEDVDILKMDAVSNHVPHPFEAYGNKGVQELPTLYWRSASTTTPERYLGRQKLEDIVKFVVEKTSKKLKNTEPILDANSMPAVKNREL